MTTKVRRLGKKLKVEGERTVGYSRIPPPFRSHWDYWMHGYPIKDSISSRSLVAAQRLQVPMIESAETHISSTADKMDVGPHSLQSIAEPRYKILVALLGAITAVLGATAALAIGMATLLGAAVKLSESPLWGKIEEFLPRQVASPAPLNLFSASVHPTGRPGTPIRQVVYSGLPDEIPEFSLRARAGLESDFAHLVAPSSYDKISLLIFPYPASGPEGLALLVEKCHLGPTGPMMIQTWSRYHFGSKRNDCEKDGICLALVQGCDAQTVLHQISK